MQLGRIVPHVLCFGLTLAQLACSRTEAPAPPPPPAPPVAEATPASFSISATNTVVTSEQLPNDGQTPIVRADFNSDLLEDVAVAEQNAEGDNIVGIYLQKIGNDPHKQYYRAGGIQQAGDYTVSALMSSAMDGHANLIVIFKYPDSSKELVHYRSSNNEFTEVMRKSIAAASPSTAQPPPP